MRFLLGPWKYIVLCGTALLSLLDFGVSEMWCNPSLTLIASTFVIALTCILNLYNVHPPWQSFACLRCFCDSCVWFSFIRMQFCELLAYGSTCKSDEEWGCLIPNAQVMKRPRCHNSRTVPIFLTTATFFSCYFDQTLGFPGEGPWNVMSINCGSFEKHHNLLDKSFDVCAFQETSIGFKNRQEAIQTCAQKGLHLDTGPCMTTMPSGQPMWGGVAIASHEGTACEVTIDDDASGILQCLKASSRFHACWVAAGNNVTVLVISLYCHSGAHSDPDKHKANDCLFRQVFQWLSQFGPIPYVLCTDCQTHPSNYPAVNTLLSSGELFDPIHDYCSNSDGSRPDTFCRNRKWDISSSSKSSIDAILVSQPAHAFVTGANVDTSLGLQHAILSVTFDFPSSVRKAFSFTPHAALDLSKLCPKNQREQIADELSNTKFQNATDNADTPEKCLQIANEFALTILQKCGATWKHGVQERGTMPRFEYCNVIKNIHGNREADSRLLNLALKTLNRIDDLAKKLNCDILSPHAAKIARTIWDRIQNLQGSFKLTSLKTSSMRSGQIMTPLGRYGIKLNTFRQV